MDEVFRDHNTTLLIMGISGLAVVLDYFGCNYTVPSILMGINPLPSVVYEFLRSRKVVFFWSGSG